MIRVFKNICLIMLTLTVVLVIWKVRIAHISANNRTENTQSPVIAAEQGYNKDKYMDMLKITLSIDNQRWNKQSSPQASLQIENTTNQDLEITGSGALELIGGRKGLWSPVDCLPDLPPGS